MKPRLNFTEKEYLDSEQEKYKGSRLQKIFSRYV